MIKTLQKSAKKYPVLLDELAHAYLEGGLTDKAFKIIEKHLKNHPQSLTGLLVKGLAYEDVGENEDAELLYREIIDLDPKNIRAITRLASLENDRKDSSDYWMKMLAALDPLCPWIQAVEVPDKKEKADHEVDAVRGWKNEVEEEAVSTTETSEIGETAGLTFEEDLTFEEGEELSVGEVETPLEEDLTDSNEKPEIPQEEEQVLDGDGSPEDEVDLDDQFDERLLKDLEELEAEEPAVDEPIGFDEKKIRPDEVTDVLKDLEVEEDIEDEIGSPEKISLSEMMEDVRHKDETGAAEQKEEVISASETSDGVETDSLEPEAEPVAEEAEELPIEEDDGDYSPSPTEMSELQKVYREITESTETKGTGKEDKTKNLNTITLARLYREQGDYARALEVYQALPETTQIKYEAEIRELVDLLNRKET